MERLEAISTGRVQLVLYRDFTVRKARALGLVGEVQNLTNGTVKTIAEGPRDALEKLVVQLRKGSLFSRVEHVEAMFVPVSGMYTSFTIRYE